MTTPDYPLLFLPGRVLQQPQRGIEIEVIGRKNRIQRDEILQFHPSDAASPGHRGRGVGRGNLGTRSSQGQGAYIGGNYPKTVSATFLFGELAARLEESDDPDPMSKVRPSTWRP